MPQTHRAALTVVVSIIAGALVLRGAAQTSSGRLADRVIPASPELVLQNSTPPMATYELIRRVLIATGVRFGIESPTPSALESGGLVRAIERGALNGLKLGEALDAICRIAPAFRWSEIDGVIVVRAIADNRGLLDVRVPHFGVTAGTLKTALDAIIAALDPHPAARLASDAAKVVGPGGRGASANGPRGRDITVSLDTPRILDVLNAIAASNGVMSWTIEYAGFPAGYDTAQIVFSEPGVEVTAESPAALRRAANIPAPDRIRMSASEIGAFFDFYTRTIPVRIGLELVPGRPLASSAPPVFQTLDIPRTGPEGVAEIVGFDPRYQYQWSEASGLFRITPKSPDADTSAILNREVPAFVAKNEPLAQVLDRIIWLLGAQPSGSETIFPAGAREMAPVSVTAPPGTLRALLDALSRAHGTVSWSVGRRTSDSPAIAFNLFGDRLHLSRGYLGPAVVTLPARTNPPETGTLRIAGADIGKMATSLAQRTHGQVGIELAAAQPDVPSALPSSRPMNYVEVSTPFDRGLADLVRLVDSRYSVTEDRGVFFVAPTAGPLRRLGLLDKKAVAFLATNAPVAEVFDRIIWAFGIQPGLGGRTLPANGPELRPVTVDLPGSPTMRELLDALCRVEGTLSWELRQPSYNSESLDLALSSYNGWRLSRRLRVPLLMAAEPAKAPAQPPVTRLPVALDHPIDQFRVFLGGDTDSSLELLGQHARAPMGIELLPRRQRVSNPDPRVIPLGTRATTLILGPGLLSDALYTLLAQLPAYAMSIADGVIDIAPVDTATRPNHFLDLPLARFDVKDVSISQAVRVLRHLMNPLFSDGPVNGSMGSILGSSAEDTRRRSAAAEKLFDRHVTLLAENATPRQILNRLVAQHGEMFWMAEYRGRTLNEAVEPIEVNCTLFLATFDDINIRRQYDPARPVTPRPPPPAMSNPRTMVTPVNGPGLRLRLPPDPQSLPGAINSLTRALTIPLGVEVIVEAGAPANAPSDQYDFTGLAVPVVLDKVLSLLPDYMWREDAGVYHIMPKRLVNNAEAALSRKVDRLDRDFASPFDALAAVHGLVGFVVPPRRAGAVAPPTFAPFTEKPVHVSVTNGTVRDVLDAIVLQGSGALHWVARYSDPNGGAGGLSLGINGVNITAPRR